MFWAAFESAAPELSRSGRERFERRRVALLGTLRPDGSPRISPVEPYFLADHLVIGVMRSSKASDLARDPRCALHSVVTDVDATDGEFQLQGVVVPIARGDLRGTDSDAWWSRRPAAHCQLYAIDIESASLVDYELAKAEMHVLRWTSGDGLTRSRRPYP